jgi:hypothetical protein
VSRFFHEVLFFHIFSQFFEYLIWIFFHLLRCDDS